MLIITRNFSIVVRPPPKVRHCDNRYNNRIYLEIIQFWFTNSQSNRIPLSDFMKYHPDSENLI